MIYFFSLEAVRRVVLNGHHEPGSPEKKILFSLICGRARYGHFLMFHANFRVIKVLPWSEVLDFILISSVLKFHKDRGGSPFSLCCWAFGRPFQLKHNNHEFWDVFLYYFCDGFFRVHFQISYWVGYLSVYTSHFPPFPFSSILWEHFFIFIFPTPLLLPFLFLLSLKKKRNKKRTQPKNLFWNSLGFTKTYKDNTKFPYTLHQLPLM